MKSLIYHLKQVFFIIFRQLKKNKATALSIFGIILAIVLYFLAQKNNNKSINRIIQSSKPSIDVISCSTQNLPNNKSFFKIIVKNSGNSDCYDVSLLVDRHNSPLASPGLLLIQSYDKIPGGEYVEYKIPLFKTDLHISNKERSQKFDDFLAKYNKRKTKIMVYFHLEYEWNHENQKSNQYVIFKAKGEKLLLTWLTNYVKPQVKRPKRMN